MANEKPPKSTRKPRGEMLGNKQGTEEMQLGSDGAYRSAADHAAFEASKAEAPAEIVSEGNVEASTETVPSVVVKKGKEWEVLGNGLDSLEKLKRGLQQEVEAEAASTREKSTKSPRDKERQKRSRPVKKEQVSGDSESEESKEQKNVFATMEEALDKALELYERARKTTNERVLSGFRPKFNADEIRAAIHVAREARDRTPETLVPIKKLIQEVRREHARLEKDSARDARRVGTLESTDETPNVEPKKESHRKPRVEDIPAEAPALAETAPPVASELEFTAPTIGRVREFSFEPVEPAAEASAAPELPQNQVKDFGFEAPLPAPEAAPATPTVEVNAAAIGSVVPEPLTQGEVTPRERRRAFTSVIKEAKKLLTPQEISKEEKAARFAREHVSNNPLTPESAAGLAEKAGVALLREKAQNAEQEYLAAHATFYKGHNGVGRFLSKAFSTREAAKLELLRATADDARGRYAFALENSVIDRMYDRNFGPDESQTDRTRDRLTKQAQRLQAAGRLQEGMDVEAYVNAKLSRAGRVKVLERYKGMVQRKEILKSIAEGREKSRMDALDAKGKSIVRKGLERAGAWNASLEKRFGKNGARAVRLVGVSFAATGLVTLGGVIAPATAGAYLGQRLIRAGIGTFGGALVGRGAGKLYEKTAAEKSAQKAKDLRSQTIYTLADLRRQDKTYAAGTAAAIEKKRKRIEALAAIAFGAGSAASIRFAHMAELTSVQEAAQTMVDQNISVPHLADIQNENGDFSAALQEDVAAIHTEAPLSGILSPDWQPPSEVAIETPDISRIDLSAGDVPSAEGVEPAAPAPDAEVPAAPQPVESLTPAATVNEGVALRGQGTDHLFRALKDSVDDNGSIDSAVKSTPAMQYLHEHSANALSRDLAGANYGEKGMLIQPGDKVFADAQGNVWFQAKGGEAQLFLENSSAAKEGYVIHHVEGKPISVAEVVSEPQAMPAQPVASEPVAAVQPPIESAPASATPIESAPEVPAVPEGSSFTPYEPSKPVFEAEGLGLESTPATPTEGFGVAHAVDTPSTPAEVPTKAAVSAATETTAQSVVTSEASASVIPETTTVAQDLPFKPASPAIIELSQNAEWATLKSEKTIDLINGAIPLPIESPFRTQLYGVMFESGVGPKQGETIAAYIERANNSLTSHEFGGGAYNSHKVFIGNSVGLYEGPKGRLILHGGDFSARLLLSQEYVRLHPDATVFVELKDGRDMIEVSTKTMEDGRLPVAGKAPRVDSYTQSLSIFDNYKKFSEFTK